MKTSPSYNEVTRRVVTSTPDLNTWLIDSTSDSNSKVVPMSPTNMRWDQFQYLFHCIQNNIGLWWYQTLDKIIDSTTDRIAHLAHVPNIDSVYFHQVSKKVIGTNGFIYDRWSLVYQSVDGMYVLFQMVQIKESHYGFVMTANTWAELQSTYAKFVSEYQNQMATYEANIITQT